MAFREEDIDGLNVPEALVSRGDDVLAVNGWQLTPRKAKYQQPTWAGRGQVAVQRRFDYYDEDLNDICKKFGDMVVKHIFQMLYPGKDQGPLAYRKDHSAVISATTGQQVHRPYSTITSLKPRYW
jgi:hypothetical protein